MVAEQARRILVRVDEVEAGLHIRDRAELPFEHVALWHFYPRVGEAGRACGPLEPGVLTQGVCLGYLVVLHVDGTPLLSKFDLLELLLEPALLRRPVHEDLEHDRRVPVRAAVAVLRSRVPLILDRNGLPGRLALAVGRGLLLLALLVLLVALVARLREARLLTRARLRRARGAARLLLFRAQLLRSRGAARLLLRRGGLP
mmetsp:Transcript_75231/g.212776  ORF Transcript_75231/g.212776 Transcript_75231/m.212776 type:complete len:201 (-) Transcript_75231:68-670(-)